MNTYCSGSDQPISSACEMKLNFSTAIKPVIGVSGNVFSSEISIIKVLDKGEYDVLETKDPATLYVIRG